MAMETAFSFALNAALITISLLGGSQNGGSIVLRIADTIAAPPGVQAERVFAPSEHSVGAFAVAAAASLMWSLFFYAVERG